jgi:hypothetical protein
MYKFIIHTKVGTFKSQAVSKEGIDETFKMLKEHTGNLTYFTINDQDELPMFIPKGALQDAVITVERVPA